MGMTTASTPRKLPRIVASGSAGTTVQRSVRLQDFAGRRGKTQTETSRMGSSGPTPWVVYLITGGVITVVLFLACLGAVKLLAGWPA